MVDLTENLADFGFRKGVFSETIVSTYNPDGSPNAAPMGLKLIDPQHLEMKIFNTSQTCQNLKTKKAAVVNLTGDIEVFYKSTFKDANPQGKVPSSWFTRAQLVDAPKLHSSDASIELSVDSFSEDSERTKFVCKVKCLAFAKQFPQVYCRAMALTVEAITHATRVQAFINQPEKQKEATKLTELIKSYADTVERVAPNSEYSMVMDDLLNRINSWRRMP